MSANGRWWHSGGVVTLALAGWLAADSACQAQSLRPATSGSQQSGGSGGASSGTTGNTGNTSRPKIDVNAKKKNYLADPPSAYPYGSSYSPGLYPYGSSYNSTGTNTTTNNNANGGPIKTYTGFGRMSYAYGPYNVTLYGKDPTNPYGPPIPGPSPYTLNNNSPYAPPYTTYPYSPYTTPYNPYTTPYNPYVSPYATPYNPYVSPYTTPYNPYVSPYNTPYNPYVSPYNTPYNPYIQPNAAPYNYQMSLLLQQQAAQQQALYNLGTIDLSNRLLQGYRQSVIPLGDGFGGSVAPGSGYRTPGY